MGRKLLVLFLVSLVVPVWTRAANKDYITYVFPVRGREYWRQGRDISNLTRLIKDVDSSQVSSTWLLHYDVLNDQEVLSQLASLKSEKEVGIFLEVTRQLALESKINYLWESEKWERADKLFLSGYDPQDRFDLIDTVFEKFKSQFGYYPKSVGAWYIDSRSLDYLSREYGVESVLGCADQYITDGYQLWGQYIGSPYYPSLSSSIEPALSQADKIDLVKIQWAARDPLLSYGIGPEYSNYSVQVNDYARYHDLTSDYLDRVIKTYTSDLDASIGQITLGIEVGELEENYHQDLVDLLLAANRLNLKTLTMSEFAAEYKQVYPDVSPKLIIESKSKDKKITWTMTPQYRMAVLTENGSQQLVDVRSYHQSTYYDNDWTVADKRQNLYRVVPAVIDQIGLHNSTEFTSNLETYLKEPKETGVAARISFWDRLKLSLFEHVPDIKASKINNRWVVGMAIDKETLCLLTCQTYTYPALESFLGLRRSLKPDVQIYAAWQDTLPSGAITVKDTTYGIDHMRELLSSSKEFENSLYLINSQPR